MMGFFLIIACSVLAVAAGCRTVDTVTSMALNAAQGAYVYGTVCGHVGNYNCDCSGLVSYAWGLPAPAIWTGGMNPTYCAKLGNWGELLAGDAILNPSSHVEMFYRWTDKSTGDHIQIGCHNTADGCSHREKNIGYYKQNGYFPCRPRATWVCGGPAATLGNASATNSEPVPGWEVI